jgi:hypothetical protein
MLSVTFKPVIAELLYAECRYRECHFAECHYAECHYAECHYAECHYAECHYAECFGTKIEVLNRQHAQKVWPCSLNISTLVIERIDIVKYLSYYLLVDSKIIVYLGH